MNILLLGKNGQVGQELQRTLSPLGTLYALGREQLDFNKLAKLNDVFAQYAPQVIVNAAAYTAVDQAECEAELAFKINAEAVQEIALYAQNTGALLIHYSSDYVFDGMQPGAYSETDLPHPLSVYGQSKFSGENAIVHSQCANLIFRTSWVFSAHGHNFVKTILKLAQQRSALNVIADQYGVPTSAALIAECTASALTLFKQHKLASGFYHLTAAGKTSWHGLAFYVVETALAQGAALSLAPQAITAIATEDYPLLAKRPKNSCLNTHKLSSALRIALPHWKIDVQRAVQQLIKEENGENNAFSCS